MAVSETLKSVQDARNGRCRRTCWRFAKQSLAFTYPVSLTRLLSRRSISKHDNYHITYNNFSRPVVILVTFRANNNNNNNVYLNVTRYLFEGRNRPDDLRSLCNARRSTCPIGFA